jgi:hypothetical protein
VKTFSTCIMSFGTRFEFSYDTAKSALTANSL